MSDLPKTIKINELPEASSINDTDLFIVEDGSVTHKITGKNLISYIKNHGDISNYYVKQSSVGVANGIAPLDSNQKVPSSNINFGTTTNTVFDGGRGKALEDGLDAHLLDTNIHHTHDNKSILDTITQEKITSWDSASSGGSSGGDADTVDGYHASDFAKSADFGKTGLASFMQSTAAENTNIIHRLQLENGYVYLHSSADGGVTWATKVIATTADLANYFPLDCSVPMSGTLRIQNGDFSTIALDTSDVANKGKGVVEVGINHVNLRAINDDTVKNYRSLVLNNSIRESDIQNALKLGSTVNGVTTEYNILHTGNINSYALPISGGSVSPSTDYTTNKVRNIVFTDADPSVGVSTTHANGSIICVYE